MQIKEAFGIMVLIVLIPTLTSCRKDKTDIPTVTTAAIMDITYTSAVSGGDVLSDGGDAVIARGVCWSISSAPTVTDSRTAESGTTGAFVSSLKDLEPDTKYQIRAYATNKAGTGYGNEINFTTDKMAVPDILTAEATSICQKSAISGGTVVSDNGSTVVAKGICWSKQHNPTISDSKISNDGNEDTYTILLPGLDVLTIYYVRSWAINRAGTSYGNEITFTTLDYGTISDVDGNLYRSLIIGTQTWMADNLRTTKYSNGETIPNITADDEWGQQIGGAYCWYENDEATYKSLYGALYNWYTLVDIRGVCPTGWHAPADSDWSILTDYLSGNGFGYGGSGDDIAKSLSSTTGWTLNTSEGTIGNDQLSNNSSGFEAVPGGVRIISGPFAVVQYTCSLWSTSEHSFTYGNAISLSGEFNSVFRGYTFKQDGGSVRCLKDN